MMQVLIQVSSFVYGLYLKFLILEAGAVSSETM